ncbi:MAG TPA: hypothetical protein VM328_11900 [Fimbriimonadaceae bacterium]|nr:hypothetical protein [Fimbriimonadaceae bacterium]
MLDAAQLLGAILILAAFVLLQQKKLDTDSAMYQVLNLVGAAVLLVVAWIGRDWGFLLLEVVWTFVSAVALWRILRSSTGA